MTSASTRRAGSAWPATWAAPVTGKRMLDIGCGQHYPETLLYHNDGNQITGIDLDVVGVGAKLAQVRRHRAPATALKRALKSLVREVVFDPVYFAELERQIRAQAQPQGHRPAHAPTPQPCRFADSTFDLVVSTDAFEHIADLDAARREVGAGAQARRADAHRHPPVSPACPAAITWNGPGRSASRCAPCRRGITCGRTAYAGRLLPEQAARGAPIAPASSAICASSTGYAGRAKARRYLTPRRCAQELPTTARIELSDPGHHRHCQRGRARPRQCRSTWHRAMSYGMDRHGYTKNHRVVIPTYNAARTLGELPARRSSPRIIRDFEVIVVDDGSSDDSAAVAERVPLPCAAPGRRTPAPRGPRTPAPSRPAATSSSSPTPIA